MYIVLFTAFFFPEKGLFGFYSVEWSFFFFAAFLIYISILAILLYQKFKFKWDRFYILLIIFLGIACLSLIDADSKTRGLLFIGQYIPYFFLFFLIINTINSVDKLSRVLNMISHLSFIFISIVIVLALVFRDRIVLNNFLLNNFNIPVNKILTYVQLPLCVSLYSLIQGRFKVYNFVFFLLAALVIVLSGSRGSLLILSGTLGLVLLKGKNIKRKVAIAVISIGIISIGFLASPYTMDRLDRLFVTSKQDYIENIASFSRLYTAQVALKLMIEHPINGVGLGNSSYYTSEAVRKLSLPKEVLDFWEERKVFETTATPLKLGAELGFAGFIFFFIFYYYLWRKMRLTAMVNTGNVRTLLTGLEIYTIVAFVHNFIDLGFANYYSWFYYGIVLAATKVYKNKTKIIASERKSK
jgi:hypothetical protein